MHFLSSSSHSARRVTRLEQETFFELPREKKKNEEEKKRNMREKEIPFSLPIVHKLLTELFLRVIRRTLTIPVPVSCHETLSINGGRSS